MTRKGNVRSLSLRDRSCLGLLAVIRGPTADLTVKMVEALIAGGVLGIEITYSTPDAEGVVRTLSHMFGDRILLGMGTVTKPEQSSSAKQAGARFLVSPICEATRRRRRF